MCTYADAESKLRKASVAEVSVGSFALTVHKKFFKSQPAIRRGFSK